jgi:DNA-binding transcriptional MocR family regulator
MSDDGSRFAYQGVYCYLGALIDSMDCSHSPRLPSLRQLARQLGVSVSTVQYAYSLLEEQGLVACQARSGYYVCQPTRSGASQEHLADDGDLLWRMLYQSHRPGMRVLSQTMPWQALSLLPALHRGEREVLRQSPHLSRAAAHPCGDGELRRMLAARYSCSAEHGWSGDDVYLGTDARSVLGLLVDALALRGQALLVVSPCAWWTLRTLRDAGVRVVEMPLCAQGRLDLPRLRTLLREQAIQWALLDSAISSPHGSLMPLGDRRAIARLLDERGVWLLENDLEGELCFSVTPRLRELVNPQRLVIFASLATPFGTEAGYGYLLSRHFGPALRQVFYDRAPPLPPVRQKALARLFRTGAADRHLHQLRAHLQLRMASLQAYLQACLGEHLECAPVAGGGTLWARCRYPVDGRQVFERLLQQRVVVAPGELFSLHERYRQHMLLACPMDPGIDLRSLCLTLARVLEHERLE